MTSYMNEKALISDYDEIGQSINGEEAEVQDSELIGFFPALMNIVNTLTGPEVLSVSNSMTLVGFTISIAMMTATTILSYIGTIIVLKMQNKVKADSINDMATKIVGKWGGQAFSTLTLLFTYSCQVAYLVMGSETVCNWLHLAGYDHWTHGFNRSLVVLVYSLVLPVALSIPRKMDILSSISTAAIGCQLLYVVSMIVRGAQILPVQGISPTVETWRFGLVFFNAFAIYSMLYAFPAVVLPLMRPYPKDMKKRYVLIGSSFVTCFTITLVPGVIGYLLFGADSNEISISSFDKKDILMQIVRTGFFIVVNASFAVVSITVMTDISSVMFNHHNPATLSWGKRIIALIISDLPPVLIAMVIPNVRPVFEVGGALGGCISNFVFPPLLWTFQSTHPWYHYTNLLMYAFALFGLVSAVIATYQAVIDAKGEL